MNTIITALLITVLIIWYLIERSRRKTHEMPSGIQLQITLDHEQEWELYHNDFSLCSKKIRMCLSELGIDYKSHHIDLVETGRYENISREFLKINPGGLVPVLLHNGHPIYESHDQIRYALSKSPKKNTLAQPKNREEQELVDHWIERTSLKGDDPISNMKKSAGNAAPGLTLPIFAAMMRSIPASRLIEGFLFHRFKIRPMIFLVLKLVGVSKLPKIPPIAKIMTSASQAMHNHLDQLESDLKKIPGPWLAGPQLSLADIGFAAIFDRLAESTMQNKFINESRPLVSDYCKKLMTRESYILAIKNRAHPLTTKGTEHILAQREKNQELDSLLSR